MPAKRTNVSALHPRGFSIYTSITTVDSGTVVVPARRNLYVVITDAIVQGGSWFQFAQDDATVLFSATVAGVTYADGFHMHGVSMINPTINDQVEFNKAAGQDSWQVWLGGFYTPTLWSAS